jgi:transposase
VQRDYDRLDNLIRPHLDYWLDSRRNRQVGRPIAASASQQAEVREFRREGKSLRWIAKATGLGLNTVRTIVGKNAGRDRTSIKREIRRQHELNRARMRTWRTRKRTRDGLPKRLKENLKKDEELPKRAGVSKAR